ncbi:CPBP family intramembrane metalloprotease [bacterium]|nr:CPBP family intramembrane metalloprotease [bacterium]
MNLALFVIILGTSYLLPVDMYIRALLVFALFFTAHLFSKRRINIKFNKKSLLNLGLIFIFYLSYEFLYIILKQPIDNRPSIHLIIRVLSVAIAEEIIYRWYITGFFYKIFKSRILLTVIVSTLIFELAHLQFSLNGVFLGLLLTVFYLVHRNFVFNVVFHAINNYYFYLLKNNILEVTTETRQMLSNPIIFIPALLVLLSMTIALIVLTLRAVKQLSDTKRMNRTGNGGFCDTSPVP